MKEIFSAFGSEVFRPLATIVIPGALAISVWFVALLQRFPVLRVLADANHTETSLLLVLASIAVGLFVEDLGSRIESRWFDRWIKTKSDNCAHSEDWAQYLRLAFKIEPVGQRYLRTILLRFKFEMGTAVALVVSGLGLLCTELSFWRALVWLAVLAVVAVYLIFVEARCSHALLSTVRHEILKGAILYPLELGTELQRTK